MKKFRFEEVAKRDLRSISQQQAYEILLSLTRPARDNTGDVKNYAER